MSEHYAHSRDSAPLHEWHRLEDHLRAVAELAARFAAKFDSGRWGYYAGLWHDLGKFARDWQQFLLDAGENAPDLGEETPESRRAGRKRGPDHSTAGAIHASDVIENKFVAEALSFVIASHHGGLPNRIRLDERLKDDNKRQRYALAREEANDAIVALAESLAFPNFFPGPGDPHEQFRRYEVLVRMLFSALVDADFLDTEQFFDQTGTRTIHRKDWPNLYSYVEPLRRHLDELNRRSSASPEVRAARANVLQWCDRAAEDGRGAFTLTVPTGGGKTLSSLWFALRHAQKHGLERIIIALPFLSIIDQTSTVLRRIFADDLGDRVLVEHHSNITTEKDTPRNRVAAENWDAPIILTTQVQLFESLFGRRPGMCRKLHRLARSVIILDEVQTLPVGLLDPILEVLQELRMNYSASILMTTATQPAMHTRNLGSLLFRGLHPKPHEIVPADALRGLFERLRRVDVRWPDSASAVAWHDLADEIALAPQVLAIVHRRQDAVDLWRILNERASGAVHLSARMCPEHRRRTLDAVRQHLGRGETCRVISTQLVEAGVDIDFPVVYRAMAGLESLAQSAGRCNREGRLSRGSFRIFRAPTEPVGSLRHHKQIAETMLAAESSLDLFAPATFRSYFDRLYAERSRDAHDVQVVRQTLQYEETADRFRMIDDATTTVFVPFDGAAEAAISALRTVGPGRERFRALQIYGVSVYPNELAKLRDRGAIELLHDSVWVLSSRRDYHDSLGLVVDREDFDPIIV